MDNIATQLQQLATIKANLANVISTYGGEVPEGFSNYAETFSTLLENTGGSGGGSEEPEPQPQPQPQARTLTNKLYHYNGITNYGSDNSAEPLTRQSDWLVLYVQDSDGVYLTDNEIYPGDMMGYCTVESGITASQLLYGDRAGQTYFKIKPFDGWTLSRFQEEGVDLSGSVIIEYEYYDPNTGDPIQQTNGPVEIYYDFTGLQE